MALPEKIEELADHVRQVRGIDLSGQPAFRDAIDAHRDELGLESYAAYAKRLEEEPGGIDVLLDRILTNSNFLADERAWRLLVDTVVPAVGKQLAPGDDIRVWHVGCGDGADTYAIAIALAERIGSDAFTRRVKIYATDGEESALRIARRGSYEDLNAVPAEIRAQYFEREDGAWHFTHDLRRCLVFGVHSLDHDRPISDVDLVACRFVLTRHDEHVRRRLQERFRDALREGGLLLVSEAEKHVAAPDLFEPQSDASPLLQPVAGEEQDRESRTLRRDPVRVLIVNTHVLFVRGLDLLLNEQMGDLVEIVGATDTYDDLRELLLRAQPDALLVDTSDRESLDVLRVVSADFPSVALLALAPSDDLASAREALEAGAHGVVDEGIEPGRIVGPLLAIADGWRTTSPGVFERLLSDAAPGVRARMGSLSAEERIILRLIAQGASDADIASELHVSTRTLKRRVATLYRKLGVDSRVEAARLAGEHGVHRLAGEGEGDEPGDAS